MRFVSWSVWILKISLLNLRNHKMRFFLSTLGIFFAVVSLVVVGNVSLGMKKRIEREIEKFGKNIVVVRAGILHIFGRSKKLFATSKKLKIEDAKAILRIEGIREAVPFFQFSTQAGYLGKEIDVEVIGAEKEIFRIKDFKLLFGRYFDDRDEKSGLRNAVLGYKVFKELFLKKDPVGKYIYVSGIPTKVVGVLEKRGVDFSGEDQDTIIYLPLKTVMRRYRNVSYINGIYAKVRNSCNLHVLKLKISSVLKDRHGIKDGMKKDFTIYSMEDLIKTEEKSLKLVSVLSRFASFISFFIGGLGIFAIMLLSVSERKLEIGIKRAVGGTKRDILFQFLVESAFISFLGGILGTLFGMLFTVFISITTGMTFVVSVKVLASSFLISVAIGILAGTYPAYFAKRFEPISLFSE